MKMQIAFEAPIGNTYTALRCSDYIFAIAPMLKIPEYAHLVREARDAGKRLYIDNGVYENQLMLVGEYLELCDKWKPDVVVAPDALLNMSRTLALTEAFFRRLQMLHPNPPFEVMVVPQGVDDFEMTRCFHSFDMLGKVDIVGLGLGAFAKNWRRRLLYSSRVLGSRIHILGMANLADLTFWSILAETCDTSLPFHLAQDGEELPFGKKHTKSIDWYSPLEGSRLALAQSNIEKIRRALND